MTPRPCPTCGCASTRWAVGDKVALKIYWRSGMPIAEIAEVLRRPYQAVVAMAHFLNLGPHPSPAPRGRPRKMKQEVFA